MVATRHYFPLTIIKPKGKEKGARGKKTNARQRQKGRKRQGKSGQKKEYQLDCPHRHHSCIASSSFFPPVLCANFPVRFLLPSLSLLSSLICSTLLFILFLCHTCSHITPPPSPRHIMHFSPPYDSQPLRHPLHDQCAPRRV